MGRFTVGEKISRLEEEHPRQRPIKNTEDGCTEDKKDQAFRTALKLDDAIKATDAGVNIAVNMQVAFLLAVTAEMPQIRTVSGRYS